MVSWVQELGGDQRKVYESVQSIEMLENGHILGVSQGLPGPLGPPEPQRTVGTSPWGNQRPPDPSEWVVTRGRCLNACSPSKMSKMVTFWACPVVYLVQDGPQSSGGRPGPGKIWDTPKM